MEKQYILPIHNMSAEYNPHDFIFSNCNSSLQTIINALPLSCGINPYKNIVLISGLRKSGKTHFANLFAHSTNATWIKQGMDIEDLQGTYFIIDDIDINWVEEELFHLFNYLCENEKIALFTSKSHNFKLRDLDSRISSIRVFNITAPDDIMIKALLSKHLAARSLNVGEDVIKFLLNRIPRSFEAIFKYVDFIDKLALEKKRNINVKFLSGLEF